MMQDVEIREHMEVVGCDGEHVGRVDRVVGQEIELAKDDAGSGLRHHLIPRSWVEAVEGDQVRLSVSRSTAREGWRERH